MLRTSHSEFIGFPIELYVEKSKEKEVTDSEDEGEAEEKKEEGDEPKIEEVDEGKEKQEKKKKKTKSSRSEDVQDFGNKSTLRTGPMVGGWRTFMIFWLLGLAVFLKTDCMCMMCMTVMNYYNDVLPSEHRKVGSGIAN